MRSNSGIARAANPARCRGGNTSRRENTRESWTLASQDHLDRGKCQQDANEYSHPGHQPEERQEKHEETEGALLKAAQKPSQSDMILRSFIEQACEGNGCGDMRLHCFL